MDMFELCKSIGLYDYQIGRRGMISAKEARGLDPVAECAGWLVDSILDELDSTVTVNASMGHRAVSAHTFYAGCFDFGNLVPSDVLILAEVVLRDRLGDLGYWNVETDLDIKSKSLKVWLSW